MNARLPLLLGLCVALLPMLPAQTAAPTATTEPATVQRTAEELDSLLGPIALYPDALLALILPASTVPSDIVLASRYLAANGTPENLARQGWDESVKSLARYPEVMKWMDDNLEWTKDLGEAFLAQPAEVMKTVQRLRAKARAAGTLVDTPEQQVVMEGEHICIVPAQPEVIYVPRYDPEVVYVSRAVYTPGPFISFSVGFAVGTWLAYDCDWDQRVIWVGRRTGPWRPPVHFTRPHYVDDPSWRHWRPSQRVRVARPDYHRPHAELVRPRPISDFAPRESRPGSFSDRNWPSRRSGPADRRPDEVGRPSGAPPVVAPAASGVTHAPHRDTPPNAAATPAPRARLNNPLESSQADRNREREDRRRDGNFHRDNPGPAPVVAPPGPPANPTPWRGEGRVPIGGGAGGSRLPEARPSPPPPPPSAPAPAVTPTPSGPRVPVTEPKEREREKEQR